MISLTRRELLKAGMTSGVALGLSGGLGALLEACAGSTPSPAKKVDKLEMWTFDPDRADWERQIGASLAQAQPNQLGSLEVQIIPVNQLYDKLTAAIAAGSGGPDLIDEHQYLWPTYMKNAATLKKFVPLNDMLGGQKSQLAVASATDPWTWKGEIYGITNELNPVVMGVRFDLFEKAGITLPIENWDTDFIEKGKQLKAKTGAYMLSFPDNQFFYWYILATQRGGSFFDGNGKYTGGADPMVETLQYIQDLIYKHQIATINSGFYGATYYADYNTDKVATILAAPWTLGIMKSQMKQLSGKWHLQSLPAWQGSTARSVTFGGTAIGIMSNAQSTELAWDFIKKATLTVDGSVLGYSLHNLFPTYIPSWSDQRLLVADDYFANQQPGSFITEAAKAMAPFHTSPYFGAVVANGNAVLVTDVLQPVMQNKAQAADAARAANSSVQQAMTG